MVWGRSTNEVLRIDQDLGISEDSDNGKQQGERKCRETCRRGQEEDKERGRGRKSHGRDEARGRSLRKRRRRGRTMESRVPGNLNPPQSSDLISPSDSRTETALLSDRTSCAVIILVGC